MVCVPKGICTVCPWNNEANPWQYGVEIAPQLVNKATHSSVYSMLPVIAETCVGFISLLTLCCFFPQNPTSTKSSCVNMCLTPTRTHTVWLSSFNLFFFLKINAAVSYVNTTHCAHESAGCDLQWFHRPPPPELILCSSYAQGLLAERAAAEVRKITLSMLIN